LSPAGNGAVITTNPDPPSSLANNAAVTTVSVIGLRWLAPIVVGGTPVIDYQVSWDQGTSTYVVLASGINTRSYSTTATLTPNTVYKFQVKSRNAFGFSITYSNEISILATSVPYTLIEPDTPAAPTTSVNSNNSVTITWVAPFDGGSAITAYYVAIQQNDGITFSIESANCNVLTTTCTVTISVL
jgi:hypothetical protein